MKNIIIARFLLLASIFFAGESLAAEFESFERITDDKKVSVTSVGLSYSQESAVSYLDSGRYVVAWMEYYDLDPNGSLFFQLFDIQGNPQSEVIDAGIATIYGDRFNMVSIEGGFVVSTQEYYRLFNNDGSSVTGVISYDNPNTDSYYWFGMTGDSDGGFVVSYNDTDDGYKPYIFKYKGIEDSGSGDFIASIALSDFNTGRPNVISIGNGEYFTIFKNSVNELVGQFLIFSTETGNFELSGSPVRVDQAESPYVSSDDAYAVSQNSEGNLLVSWYDARVRQNGSATRIYGRIISPSGSFLTNEFIIADEIVEEAFYSLPNPENEGSNMYPWTPTATTSFGDKFLVGWLEKDVSWDLLEEGEYPQIHMAAHIKGRVMNNDGTFATDIFKMETNENDTGTGTIRRTLYPYLASNGTDSVVMTWFDGRNSTDSDAGTEIRVNFWQANFAEETVTTEDPEKAKITSYKAEIVTDKTKCPEKLKITIKGKRFDNGAEVFLGGKEAKKVDVKDSRKLTATFCLADLLKAKVKDGRSVKVKNPGTNSTEAKKKLRILNTTAKIDKNNLNQNLTEGIKNIQRVLIRLRYLNSQNLTGVIDQTTLNAIKQFQRDKGLPQVGNVGPLTRGEMQGSVK